MEKVYTVSKNQTECWLWFRSWTPYCKDWVPKKWCFRTVVLEKTLESPVVCKEIKPVNPKGSQSWIFIGRSDLKLQYFGHLMQRTDSLEKTLRLGKMEGRGRRGMTEDEMVGWHHRLNGLEFEQTRRDSEGQGSLVCCSLWGHKVLDTTELLENKISWTGNVDPKISCVCFLCKLNHLTSFFSIASSTNWG